MASGAAKRYTQAVFSLAREKGNFDAWLSDLAILNALVRDERAAAYMASPNVSAADKQRLLDAALERSQPEVRNLARLLLERQRIGIVPEMFEAFQELVLDAQGIAIADVTTAVPLDESGQAAVRQRLSALVGRDVQLRLKVDPEIIGGIIARIGDQLIDGSVINQLRRLRTRLAVEGR
jgi:F-type H+-transporting ATPase subunit delta